MSSFRIGGSLVARVASLAFLAFVLMLGVAGAAQAATFTVNTTADTVDANPGDGICADTNGQCSLRAAVMEANASGGADTISVPAGTYTLTLGGGNDGSNSPNAAIGDLDLTDSVTINGAGAGQTTVQAGTSAYSGIDRVFELWSGYYTGNNSSAGIAVAINGLTIQNGDTSNTYSYGDLGGGIRVNGGAGSSDTNLTLQGVTVTNNRSYCEGGGVYAYGASDLTIKDSTISNNESEGSCAIGGGIYQEHAGTGTTSMTVTSSTISGNTGSSGGGGIYNDGASATLNGVSLDGNAAPNGVYGGGAYNTNGGTLAIEGGSVISSNTADGGAGLRQDGSTSTTTIDQTTISSNTSVADGGGIQIVDGSAAITGSTFTANQGGYGGAVASGYGGGPAATVVLTNDTLEGNASGSGAAVRDSSGTIHLVNDTVAGNTGSAALSNSGTTIDVENTILANASNCGGTITSLGHNIDSGTGCGFAATGDQEGVDPQLGALQDNGGPTATQALPESSPAVDAGDNAACPVTDQRGVSRPQDGGSGNAVCDIGAFELHIPQPSLGSVPTPSQQTEPTFSGQGDPTVGDSGSVQVKLYQGSGTSGTLLGTLSTAFDPSTHEYSVQPSGPLADGTYTAQTEQSESGGSVGKSTAVTFVVDTAPPQITITTPADGAQYANGAVVSADYSCADGGSGVASCSGPVASGSPIDTSTAGSHTFTVTATDNAGNSTQKQVSYAVAPDVQIDSGPTGYTDRAQPQFSFSSTASGATFQCAVEPQGQSPQPSDYASCTSPYAPSSPLSEGQYTFYVYSSASGLSGDPASRAFTVDTTAPSLTLHPLPTRSRNPRPVFSGAAGTAPGDQDRVRLTIFAGRNTSGKRVGNPLSATVNGSTGTFLARPASPLHDGTYTVQAVQSDQAGNRTSQTRTFTVDTTPPHLVITAGPANASTVTSHEVTFRFTVSSDAVKLRCKLGSRKWRACTSHSEDVLKGLINGPVTWKIQAADAAGNLITITRTFTVRVKKRN